MIGVSMEIACDVSGCGVSRGVGSCSSLSKLNCGILSSSCIPRSDGAVVFLRCLEAALAPYSHSLMPAQKHIFRKTYLYSLWTGISAMPKAHNKPKGIQGFRNKVFAIPEEYSMEWRSFVNLEATVLAKDICPETIGALQLSMALSAHGTPCEWEMA